MTELKEKFEKMLEGSANSSSVPLQTQQYSQVHSSVSKNKSDNKFYILICVIVIAVILFKFNDIMSVIFGNKSNTEDKKIASNVYNEAFSDDEENFDENQQEECDIQEIKTDTPQTEIELKSNSKTYKKNKDPLFQEFQ